MRYLTIEELLALHSRIIATSGGGPGLRDRGALESAVAQPQMTFGGADLYVTIALKAAALGHSLISNHLSSMVTSGLVMQRWKSCSF